MGFRYVLSLAIPAGQPAAGERAPGNDAHPILLSHWQHIGLDTAYQDRVRRLLSDKAGKPAALGDPVRLNDPVCREGR